MSTWVLALLSKSTFRFFQTAQVRTESVVAGSFRSVSAWILGVPGRSKTVPLLSNFAVPHPQGSQGWPILGPGASCLLESFDGHPPPNLKASALASSAAAPPERQCSIFKFLSTQTVMCSVVIVEEKIKSDQCAYCFGRKISQPPKQVS